MLEGAMHDGETSEPRKGRVTGVNLFGQLDRVLTVPEDFQRRGQRRGRTGSFDPLAPQSRDLRYS